MTITNRLSNAYAKGMTGHDIQQAHVTAIRDIPVLTDGNSKEMRRFHDVANQHLRAMRNMKHDEFDTFISAFLELKFNKATSREWQKFSLDQEGIPSYDVLLKFVDLQARCSETTESGSQKWSKGPLNKKGKSNLPMLPT